MSSYSFVYLSDVHPSKKLPPTLLSAAMANAYHFQVVGDSGKAYSPSEVPPIDFGVSGGIRISPQILRQEPISSLEVVAINKIRVLSESAEHQGAINQGIVVPVPRLVFKATFKVDEYQPNVFIPPSNGTISHPATQAILGEAFWLKWSDAIPVPTSWVIWVGTAPLLRDIDDIAIPSVTVTNGKYEHLMTGMPTDGSDYYLTLHTVTGSNPPVFVDFKQFNYALGNHISLVSPSGDIVTNTATVAFNVPTGTDQASVTVTDDTSAVVVTDANIFPTSSYTFSGLASSINTLSIQVTVSLTSDPDSVFITSFQKTYDPFALAVIADLNSPGLTDNSAAVSWLSPGWTDDTSWTVLVGKAPQLSNMFVSNTLPAGARTLAGVVFPPEQGVLDCTVTWVRNGVSQSTSIQVNSPSLNFNKQSAGLSFAGITEGVTWTPMTLYDHYRVVAKQGSVTIFDSGELTTNTGQLQLTNLPLGDPTNVDVTLYHTYNTRVSSVTKTWAPSTSLFLNDLTGVVIGDAVLLKWHPILLGQDSLKVVISGVSGGTDLPANAVSSWVYDIPTEITPVRLHLVSVTLGVETVLQTLTLGVSPTFAVLTAPSVITGSTASVTWSLPIETITHQEVVTLAGDGTEHSVTGQLPAGDTSTVLSGIPTTPDPIRVRISAGYGNSEHGTTFLLENTRLYQNLLTPVEGFTATSQLITWEVITAKTLDAVKVQVTDPSTGLVYFDSGVLIPTQRDILLTGLPNAGQDIKVLLMAREAGTAWVEKEFIKAAYDVNATTPLVTSPDPSTLLPPGVIPFTLSANGNPIATWRLILGTAPRTSDLYDSGVVTVVQSTFQVPPMGSGEVVYATLYYTDTSAVTGVLDYTYTTTKATPKLISPDCLSGGVHYTGDTHVYEWASEGLPVDSWQLTLSVAGAGFFDSGVLPGSSTGVTVTNHGLKGRLVSLTLKYHTADDGWQTILSSCIEFIAYASMSSPVPGTLLENNSQLFSWDANGVTPDSWSVILSGGGVVPDQTFTGILPSTTSLAISGLNPEGSSRKVLLGHRYSVGDPYLYVTYNYPTKGEPRILSVNQGPSVTTLLANWEDRGTAVTQYVIRLGSSSGASDYGQSPILSPQHHSYLFTGLPRDGSLVYATLEWGLSGGGTGSNQFIVSVELYEPFMLDVEIPYTGTKVVFWDTGGVAVSEWGLEIGTSTGAVDIFSQVSGIPSNQDSKSVFLPNQQGDAFYQLHYRRADDGVWHTVTYTHPLVEPPKVIAPLTTVSLPNNFLVVLYKGTDLSVDRWQIQLGNAQSDNSFYDSGEMLEFSVYNFVTGVPQDGAVVWLTFRYYDGVSQTWSEEYTQYQADINPPTFTTSLVGTDGLLTTTIPDFNYTFSWNSNGLPLTQLELIMGSTKGGDDVYHSPVLSGVTTSHEVTGIPSDGRDLYLTLLWTI